MATIKLEVTFTGLCLFLVQRDCRRVGVVLPDFRHGIGLGMKHPDGSKDGVHHVGYVRIDGGHITPAMAGDEWVHRLDGEEIRFDIPEVNDLMDVRTMLPAMERVAPHPDNRMRLPDEPEEKDDCTNVERSLLEPIPNIFAHDAPLTARIRLTGQSVVGKVADAWIFDPVFDETRPPYGRVFAKSVTWTRTVSVPDPQPGQLPTLNMTLAPFGDTVGRTLPLVPVQQLGENVIAVTVANLCADNPLEWEEFGPQKSQEEDPDFKLLYKVLQPVGGGTYADILNGKLLPIPKRDSSKDALGVENCIGMKITVDHVA